MALRIGRWGNISLTLSAALVAGAYVVPPGGWEGAAAPLGFVSFASFAAWFGMAVWITFINGPVLFTSLPKESFGRVQHVLFPAYFSASCVLLSLSLAAAVASSSLHPTAAAVVATALACSVVNLVLLGPLTSAAMFERWRLEKELGVVDGALPDDADEEGRKAYKKARKSFGMLHGLSNLANLVAVCASMVEVWRLSHLVGPPAALP
mmetsp:Transcript_12183/g.41232  ORF Transcript_12183/g.41232 Transcript_12183/m.41232 type:complete len:208 (+) Transcript_12183:80-703(+)